MKNFPIPRLDRNPELHDRLLNYCRLSPGQIWEDEAGHRVGCLDATNTGDVSRLMGRQRARLALQDPPYNMVAFDQRQIKDYVDWCRKWIAATTFALHEDSSLYVWLGADQRYGFQPLPDFMIMMRATQFQSRSLITMRNQRGYGTQRNWMAIRQELLYYTRGTAPFNVSAEYTEIPKVLRGYYKTVNGEVKENLERSKSENLRAGNVWVDIQQVFYRMEENVNGCYAQKPLKTAERIIAASSNKGDLVLDLFSHSGTTLLACEQRQRVCCAADVDPVYCEVSIRRLERFRSCGRTGWQNGNPFEAEILADRDLSALLQADAKEESKAEQLTLL